MYRLSVSRFPPSPQFCLTRSTRNLRLIPLNPRNRSITPITC